jgi:hypothetical protein
MVAPKGATKEDFKELAKQAGAAISQAATFENLAKVTVHLPDTLSKLADKAVKALDSHINDTLKPRQEEAYRKAQDPNNSKAAQMGHALQGLGADLEQFAAEAARDTIKEIRGESTGRGEVHAGEKGLAGLYETRSTYGGYSDDKKDDKKKNDKSEVESRAGTPEKGTPGGTSMLSAAATALTVTPPGSASKPPVAEEGSKLSPT